jgi:hypothetical protein
MKRTMTAKQWVEENVVTDGLKRDVVEALKVAINNDNCEDGTYTALVYDLVSGSAGHYIPYYALKMFCYEGLDMDNMDEFIHDELESYAGAVADILNESLPNEVTVGFGHWDADGTYCLMAYLDEQEYLNNKDESHNFIGENFGDI